MTARWVGQRTARSLAGITLGAMLAALTAAGCSRPVAGSTEIAPTHIPQPTPDPTMREIIAGRGSPVVYLPPLEIRGSPTPGPATGRSGAGGGASAPRPAAKPAAPARDPAPAREPAPAPAPAPKPVAPAAAPTAAAKPAAAPTRAPAPNSGSGAPPSIFNPSNVLPGSGVRPNPTPGR